jgi:geranylgeranyl diphosphate synthase type I
MTFAENFSLIEQRDLLNTALADFSAQESDYLRSIGSELEPVASAMHSFICDSGKRLRPLFAYIGYLGSGANPDEAAIKASASLELVHVCALMHDDVMDGSDSRRGAPSIHRAFEALHKRENSQGSAEQFGINAAILLGDLALVWSAKMLHQSGIESSSLLRALPMYDEMRVELMAGQYLDIYESTLKSQSVERSLKIARFKSGKYTIERPLHFGASLGSAAPAEIMKIYSRYGLPLGEAFQLRDDVLGVFGNPSETGKPAGDDLREGKRTVLLATTLERVSPAQKSIIEEHIGNTEISSDAVEEIRSIIVNTDALAAVEDLITSLTQSALEAVDSELIAEPARKALIDLATIVTKRNT